MIDELTTHGSVPLLSVEGLGVTIHNQVILEDISLELKAGESLGIIGESGSGKSMLALSVMSLLPGGSKLSGTICFDNRLLHRLTENELCAIRGQDIGMVFQEPMTALNPVKTIGEQVSEIIRLHRSVSRRESRALTESTLERVGLPIDQFPLDRYPHQLSGGQRQRVVIAIAVACQPKLLIADEPTTALDVTTQAGILDLLKRLQEEEGMALLLISHDLAVVSNMVDSAVVMHQGKVVERGPMQRLYQEPEADYTRRLFASSQLDNVSARIRSKSQQSLKYSRPLLDVNGLVCEYKAGSVSLFGNRKSFRAVDEVSLSICRGESIGLVGESGCGKSTLTRALLGLLPIQQGQITFNNHAIHHSRSVNRSVRQKMQVVFQDPYGSFNPRHRVHRLVSEPLHLTDESITKQQRHYRVAESLESVGLEDSDMHKYIHEFSGGQRQRIAIARALILKPALVLLDEAVSALDVSVRAQVLELLNELAVRKRLAYLFISHDLSVVRHVTDRVCVMQAGKIIESGETEDVFSNPKHPYTKQLIDAVPTLNL